MHYKNFFNFKYSDLYRDLLSNTRTKKETEYLTKWIPDKTSKILDMGCGEGRHLKHLYKFGYKNLVGIDFSSQQLNNAKANLENMHIRLYESDFASFCDEGNFDVILQLFQSFGYEDFNYDKRTIENAYSLLKQGGLYLLDLRNPIEVKNGGEIDFPSNIRLTFINQGKRLKISYGLSKDSCVEINIYDEDEIVQMFEEAGFIVEKVLGSLEGSDYSSKAERLIIIGRKS